MSTPAQIITDVRRFANVTTTQYSDASAYLDLNKVKDEIWNRVVTQWVSSYYNWEEWTTDTVALQGEYTLDIPTGTNDGTKTLNTVYINYDGETYTNTGVLKYVKAREVDPKNLPYEWGYYQENQSVDEPIYFQKDNAVFIAPTPLSDTAGSNRLQLEGIRKIANWDSSTTELQTKIPVEYHYVLELGLIPYAYMSKGMDMSDINNARTTYRNAANDVVKQMTSRIETPFFNKYPDQINSDEITFTTA